MITHHDTLGGWEEIGTTLVQSNTNKALKKSSLKNQSKYEETCFKATGYDDWFPSYLSSRPWFSKNSAAKLKTKTDFFIGTLSQDL